MSFENWYNKNGRFLRSPWVFKRTAMRYAFDAGVESCDAQVKALKEYADFMVNHRDQVLAQKSALSNELQLARKRIEELEASAMSEAALRLEQLKLLAARHEDELARARQRDSEIAAENETLQRDLAAARRERAAVMAKAAYLEKLLNEMMLERDAAQKEADNWRGPYEAGYAAGRAAVKQHLASLVEGLA